MPRILMAALAAVVALLVGFPTMGFPALMPNDVLLLTTQSNGGGDIVAIDSVPSTRKEFFDIRNPDPLNAAQMFTALGRIFVAQNHNWLPIGEYFPGTTGLTLITSGNTDAVGYGGMASAGPNGPLFVFDFDSIVRIDLEPAVQETVIATISGSPGLDDSSHLDILTNGNLILAFGTSIVEVEPVNAGAVTPLQNTTGLVHPAGVAVDRVRNHVYIVDQGNLGMGQPPGLWEVFPGTPTAPVLMKGTAPWGSGAITVRQSDGLIFLLEADGKVFSYNPVNSMTTPLGDPANPIAPGYIDNRANDIAIYEPASTCGNGTVESGETCDAGAGVNGTLQSCCDATCQFSSIGVYCDDDQDPCNGGGTCSGTSSTCTATGVDICNDHNDCTTDLCTFGSGCDNLPLANGEPCEDGNLCTAGDTCQAAVCTGGSSTCAEPEKSKILVKSSLADPEKRQLSLTFGKGSAVSLAQLGDPTEGGSTSYTVEVYQTISGDQAAFVGATIPAGGTCKGKPCWKPLGSKNKPPTGYKYNDPDGAISGIQQLVLQVGDPGKSKALVKAKGAGLPMPMPANGQLLRQENSVSVRIMNSLGQTWVAKFCAPGKGTDQSFQDKLPDSNDVACQ